MIKVESIYYGKAKTIFSTDDPNKLIIEFRDSLTAFDGKKKGEIHNKGFYNAQISSRLFKLLEENNIKTHFEDMFSPTDMIVKSVEIIKIEVIIRNIATGRIINIYPFYEGKKFDPAILILDYKSDKYHDPMINDDIAIALDLSTKDELFKIRKMSHEINSILIQYLEGLNILLPDIKLEFGRYKGDIILADEISCDTCRFWDKNTGESLDKDVFRFNKGDVENAYKRVAKKILPEIFINDKTS